MTKTLNPRALATVVLANALEFFEYFAYATFARFIGAAFFPHGDAGVASLAAFGTFATGFLMRPIGALVLGAYADRVGRKPALLLNITLVAAGTLGMALLPGYDVLGVAAPLLLLACRMLQGFAIGGEIGAAGAYLIEQCAPARRGLYCGWLLAGQGLALLAIGACGLLMNDLLTAAQLGAWGWRIPFLLAVMMIPVQVLLRRRLLAHDIPQPVAAEVDDGHLQGWKVLALGTLLIAGGTVPTYVATFTAPFEMAGTMPTLRQSFLVTIALGAITAAASIVGGRLADRLGYPTVVILARLASIIAVVPTYLAAMYGLGNGFFVAGIIAVTAASCLAAGPTVALLLSTVRSRSRATSLSFIYAVGVAVFGGTAPALVATWNAWAGSRMAAAWTISAAALGAIVAVRALQHHQTRVRD
ncbi:MFS transporter [Pandoraea anapnoica]|uniref:MFS transporter n=1 Tax=Pandoraea anapnoica TaxID=2508301 RepID=UPI0015830E37|nr:MFS transporter [Pandoraea anapnoica]